MTCGIPDDKMISGLMASGKVNPSGLTVTAPGGADSLLLHTCCAPCSSAIVECLLRSGIRPVIYYCNPNIFPEREYLVRKNECTRYAESLGLEIVDADYDHDIWLSEVSRMASEEGIADIAAEPERGGRCLQCFKLRLLRSAEYAAANGFSVLTTTLASSRWKSLDQINAAGRWAVEQVNRRNAVGGETVGAAIGETGGNSGGNAGGASGGVLWWEQNWRKGGLQERRLEIIREYGFYNQLWCGCEFSHRNQPGVSGDSADDRCCPDPR